MHTWQWLCSLYCKHEQDKKKCIYVFIVIFMMWYIMMVWYFDIVVCCKVVWLACQQIFWIICRVSQSCIKWHVSRGQALGELALSSAQIVLLQVKTCNVQSFDKQPWNAVWDDKVMLKSITVCHSYAKGYCHVLFVYQYCLSSLQICFVKWGHELWKNSKC